MSILRGRNKEEREKKTEIKEKENIDKCNTISCWWSYNCLLYSFYAYYEQQ